MAEALLPLESTDAQSHIDWLQGNIKLLNTVLGVSLSLVASAPGAPNIAKMIMKALKKMALEIAKRAKAIIIAFLLLVLLGALMKNIPAANKVIRKMNKIIIKIKKVMNFIKNKLAPPILILIAVVMVVFIIAKVISLLPSFGFGVVVTSHVGLASTVATMTGAFLKGVIPVPVALVAIYILLLQILNFLENAMSFAKGFQARTEENEQIENEDATKSAEEWDEENNSQTEPGSGVDEDATGTGTGQILEDLLNEGEGAITDAMKNNLDIRLGLQMQINNLLATIPPLPDWSGDSGANSNQNVPDGQPPETSSPFTDTDGNQWEWIDPPGEWRLINPPGIPPDVPSPYTDADGNVWEWVDPPGEWRLAPGSVGVIKDIVNGLQKELDNIGGTPTEDELSNANYSPSQRAELEGIFNQLGNQVITSLLYPDRDITIKSATENKGKRYGFYQEEITKTKKK